MIAPKAAEAIYTLLIPNAPEWSTLSESDQAPWLSLGLMASDLVSQVLPSQTIGDVPPDGG